MGFILVLLWCSGVVGKIFPYNSRFGAFIPGSAPMSRLALLRELPCKDLIWRTVFVHKTAAVG